MIYTEKQRELLRLFQCGGLRRINILHGSVRSGKTWISLVLWAFWVLAMPRDGNYLMAAKTLTGLKRNCLDLLGGLVGERNFSYSLAQKQGRLFGRTIYLEGVNDARAESKIRGMTLTGAYCDELTLFTEDFFAMLLSRLSMPGAKLFGTTNPDTPEHWLKKNYIDRRDALDMLVMEFRIEDNTFLDAEYVRQLKTEYAGVFYERFILGRWVVAEGLVYADFAKWDAVTNESTEGMSGRFFVSIDYGTRNPCSMGLWCVANGRALRLDESYFDSRAEGRQRTDEEHYAALERLTAGKYIDAVIVDPSAASLIETIRRHGKYAVRPAENAVVPGINVAAGLLQCGRMKIHARCKDAIREFGLYRWDERKTEDAVIKEHDHAMDEIRYFAATILAHDFRWLPWRAGNV